MNLLETIESDLREAIKGGESAKNKAETLRMIKSDLMYEKAKTGKDLSPEQMIEVVSRSAKKRREAIEEFKKANREDLVSKESSELVIIESYLPKQLSEEEVEKIVSEKIAELGAVSQKDMGKIMGVMMKELKGKADGNVVKKVITKMLEGK